MQQKSRVFQRGFAKPAAETLGGQLGWS